MENGIIIKHDNIVFTEGMIDTLKEYDIEPRRSFTFSETIECEYPIFRLMNGNDVKASKAFITARANLYYKERLKKLKLLKI